MANASSTPSTTLSEITQAFQGGRWTLVERLCRSLMDTGVSDDPQIWSMLCQSQRARGALDAAAATAAQIVDRWGENASAWQNLAAIQFKRNRYSDALQAFREAISREPRSPLVLIQASAAWAQLGNSEMAHATASSALLQAPALREAYRDRNAGEPVRQASLAANTTLRDYQWDRLTEALETVEIEAGESLDRMRGFIDGYLGRKPIEYPHPLQRPSHLYVPGLTAKPWWERDEVPWVKKVEAQLDAISEELRDVLTDQTEITPYIDRTENTPDDLKAIAGTMAWSAFHFYRHGKPIEDHIRRCPRTMDVVHQMPLMTQQSHGAECLFSIVQPHSKIPAHVGHSNVKLGVHFPLIVPPDCGFRVGGEARSWTVGQCLIFDDGFVHEVWNDSDAHRVVLIFDMWHPDLSEPERHALDVLTETSQQIREDREKMDVNRLLAQWPETAIP